MTDELTYAEALINILCKKPVVYIDHIYEDILYDQESGDIEKIEFKKFGSIQYNPTISEIKKAIENFYREVKLNKYRLLNFTDYIKRCFFAIKRNDEEFNYFINVNQESYKLRKGIKIYFNGEPEPIVDNKFLNHQSLTSIQGYCQFQNEAIFKLLNYLNEQISEDLFVNSDKPTKDENDPRIYIKDGPSKVREYFSFLSENTKYDRSILSDNDFEYFLSKNFQGFSQPIEYQELSFELISAKHLQYLAYTFYRKYSDIKEYKRNRWAQLLKDTFPTKYSGDLGTIATNFKIDKYNSTKSKFDELEITLPE